MITLRSRSFRRRRQRETPKSFNNNNEMLFTAFLAVVRSHWDDLERHVELSCCIVVEIYSKSRSLWFVFLCSHKLWPVWERRSLEIAFSGIQLCQLYLFDVKLPSGNDFMPVVRLNEMYRNRNHLLNLFCRLGKCRRRIFHFHLFSFR